MDPNGGKCQGGSAHGVTATKPVEIATPQPHGASQLHLQPPLILRPRVAALCARQRLRHLRTRPYTPRTNGKAERFIQTLLREWAYRRPYATSAGRTRALGGWLHYYSWHRRHSGLAVEPPVSRVRAASLVRLHT
jgi:transposase InsO family protein